jgi:hypothetical protein
MRIDMGKLKVRSQKPEVAPYLLTYFWLLASNF